MGGRSLLWSAPAGTSGQSHDPVCGMLVAPAAAKNLAQHDGQTYFFHCGGCKAKCMAAPAQYLNRRATHAPSAPNAPVAQGYICPMHPQMRKNEPGRCSICGMALEPDDAL